MNIRDALTHDAPAIARVHIDTWRDAYRGIVSEGFLARMCYNRTESMVMDRILNEGSIGVVAEDVIDGIVGFGAGGPERTGDPHHAGEIYALYVLPRHQHRGIGRGIIQALVQRLNVLGISSLLVWVLERNPCRFFYEGIGGVRELRRWIKIGDEAFEEIAYGWKDTSIIMHALYTQGVSLV